MKKPKIILLSGKASSGKDTFANLFKDIMKNKKKKVLHTAYADYLKFLCQKHFNWDGVKDDNGREILQKLGTDVGRKNNINIWVNVMIETIKGFGHLYDYVVISDCRFKNEIDIWKEEGFETITIYLTRQNYENELTKHQKNHISENSLNEYPFQHRITIENVEELKTHIFNLCEFWLKNHSAKNLNN